MNTPYKMVMYTEKGEKKVCARVRYGKSGRISTRPRLYTDKIDQDTVDAVASDANALALKIKGIPQS